MRVGVWGLLPFWRLCLPEAFCLYLRRFRKFRVLLLSAYDRIPIQATNDSTTIVCNHGNKKITSHQASSYPPRLHSLLSTSSITSSKVSLLIAQNPPLSHHMKCLLRTPRIGRIRKPRSSCRCTRLSTAILGPRLVIRSGGVRLARSLGLGAEVGGGAGAAEEAANQGLEEGVEDDLGAAGMSRLVICWVQWVGYAYLVWGRAIQRIKTNLKM